MAREHCAFLPCSAGSGIFGFHQKRLSIHGLFSEESQCPIVASVAEELGEAIHGAGAKLRSLFLGAVLAQDTIRHDSRRAPKVQEQARRRTIHPCRDREKHAALRLAV